MKPSMLASLLGHRAEQKDVVVQMRRATVTLASQIRSMLVSGVLGWIRQLDKPTIMRLFHSFFQTCSKICSSQMASSKKAEIYKYTV